MPIFDPVSTLWMGWSDCRKASTSTRQNNNEKRRHTSIRRLGFEPTISEQRCHYDNSPLSQGYCHQQTVIFPRD